VEWYAFSTHVIALSWISGTESNNSDDGSRPYLSLSLAINALGVDICVLFNSFFMFFDFNSIVSHSYQPVGLVDRKIASVFFIVLAKYGPFCS
jgi:hypothetical protein